MPAIRRPANRAMGNYFYQIVKNAYGKILSPGRETGKKALAINNPNWKVGVTLIKYH